MVLSQLRSRVHFGQRPSTRSQVSPDETGLSDRRTPAVGLQNVQALTELDAQIELHRVPLALAQALSQPNTHSSKIVCRGANSLGMRPARQQRNGAASGQLLRPMSAQSPGMRGVSVPDGSLSLANLKPLSRRRSCGPARPVGVTTHRRSPTSPPVVKTVPSNPRNPKANCYSVDNQ